MKYTKFTRHHPPDSPVWEDDFGDMELCLRILTEGRATAIYRESGDGTLEVAFSSEHGISLTDEILLEEVSWVIPWDGGMNIPWDVLHRELGIPDKVRHESWASMSDPLDYNA